MEDKQALSQSKRRIKQLEKEIKEYVGKEKRLAEKRKLSEYYHFKRTLSLIKINEELNKEIYELKSAENIELERVSSKLKERTQYDWPNG